MSSKHPGQFKRICSAALSLLYLIVDLEYENGEENIFYVRFVSTPVADLRKIGFDKHILSKAGGEDVMEATQLLAILRNDHRTDDGGLDPIEIEMLLDEV